MEPCGKTRVGGWGQEWKQSGWVGGGEVHRGMDGAGDGGVEADEQ